MVVIRILPIDHVVPTIIIIEAAVEEVEIEAEAVEEAAGTGVMMSIMVDPILPCDIVDQQILVVQLVQLVVVHEFIHKIIHAIT